MCDVHGTQVASLAARVNLHPNNPTCCWYPALDDTYVGIIPRHKGKRIINEYHIHDIQHNKYVRT